MKDDKKRKPRLTVKERITKLKNEIACGRHDGWSIKYFKEKLEKIKRNLNLG